jgi:hypothetical protein
VRYVDAGYVVALSVLAAYAAGLVLRRRRLEQAAAAVNGDAAGAPIPQVPRAGSPTSVPGWSPGPEPR